LATDVSDPIVTGVLQRETRAIARALSIVADDRAHAAALLSSIKAQTGRALIVGVTGPPGAGKSTLVDRLIGEIRRTGRTVGVLAVDPSSPFSGGALLGDRVRMQSHAGDDGVFVRSLATRGQLGGLSSTTAAAADVLDAAGFDVVLIETVGVGQDEIDIAGLADVRVVVVVPDAGDDVQDMKAGLMEIGDIFVVNKSDRPGADRAVASLQAEVGGERRGVPKVPHVLATVATDGTGVSELVRTIDGVAQDMREVIAERRATRARQGVSPTRIDHVGVAVSDASELVAFLEQAFGARAEPPLDVSAHGVRVRFVRCASNALEILEPIGNASPIAPFLARRGPGLHHLAMEVDDLPGALARLRERGTRLIDEVPRRGAEGRNVAFVHPSAAGGVLIELIEKERS
jgi:LAO/AO transport system kinase